MPEITTKIKNNLEKIQERIERAAVRSSRTPQNVRLVLVTKTRPVELIRAAIDAGVRRLGENYPDEALSKIMAIHSDVQTAVSWHMIGHVQSRKARIVAENFDFLHSLDSLKLAEKLNGVLAENGKVLPVLVEMNVSGEESKGGWEAWNESRWPELLPVIEHIRALKYLKLCGLMTMPPLFRDPEEVRPYFQKLRALRDFFKTELQDFDLPELSMGTSMDFEVAIEEGATFVRIGQAILGDRPSRV